MDMVHICRPLFIDKLEIEWNANIAIFLII